MKKAIIYTYATLDSRNSGWYKVGLTTKNADERIKEQDNTSNYQKLEKLLEFDFTKYINQDNTVEKIEKMFHNYLRYKLRCEVRRDKNREWFVTNGLGPIHEARKYVISKLKIKPPSIIRKSPKGKYQWQWDLVLHPFLNHFKQGFNKANSLIFCGGGKTIISYWTARLIRPLVKNRINLTVVVVPSLYLIKQTLDEFIEQQNIRGEDFQYLCVCSDKKISGNTEADLSIKDIPFATTNEKLIRQFATEEYNTKGLRVIFTTYQSGRKLANALKDITVDFTIYDEAHKAVGDTKKTFAHLVLDKNFKSQYKWFITATPKEYNGNIKQNKNTYFGFENKKLLGKTICNITYRQLVKLGAVLPYEILVLSVTKEEIKRFISNNTWVRDEMFMENEQFQSRYIASIIAADKAFKQGYIKRLLTFHSRNEHAINFEKALLNLKDSKIFNSFNNLDFIGRCQGNQSSTNEMLLELFSDSKKGIISNARVLTEGVNIPSIDSVLFCDPKTSAADVAQGFSRSIRLMKGKKKARIIVPIIYDSDEKFQPMIDIMDYVSSYDTTLWDAINIIPQSQNRNRITSSRIINTNELEIDNININDFYNEISLSVWNRFKSQNGFWDDEEKLKEWTSDKESRNELTSIDAALRRLEANNYFLWKKLCPHIPLPKKKQCWEDKLQWAVNICNDYKGTYSQFRKDYFNVIKTFTGISEMKSSPYTKSSELIEKYCSHMKKDRFSFKTTTSQFVIDTWLKKCKNKNDVLQIKEIHNLPSRLKKWPHLKEAMNYYNNLPNSSRGLKTGQRRGGGWSLKQNKNENNN